MEYIEKFLKKAGWMSIIETIMFAILGIIVICYPEGIVKVISYILGGMFIVVGVAKIINYFIVKGKYDLYNYNLIYGLMACVLGLVIILYSNTIGAIFRIAIGIWIIYSAFMRMSLAIKLKTLDLKIWIYSLILAIVMLICGLYVTINSGALIVTIGIMMVVYAVIDLIENIIFMKNVKETF